MSAGAAEQATSAAEDGRALLARIKPTKRRVTTFLCLNPELLERWQEEAGKLEEMRAKDITGNTTGRLSDRVAKVSAKTKKQAQVVADIEAEIEAKQVRFVLEPISRPEFKAIVAVHPPRKDNVLDMHVGYDRDAVGDELVRACIVSPVFDDQSWAELVELLAISEWDELKERAQEANGKVVEPPKSQMAATLLQGRSASSSRPPRAGG